MSKNTTIAVDLAKNVFEIAVSSEPGRVHERHRVTRSRLLTFFAQQPPAKVVMEACGMSHHWGRELQRQGHRIVLLPAAYVRPYVPRNKTDRGDAKAILEASRNAEIEPVPVKSVEQQAIASLHRLRSTWVAARTSRINTLRGLLRELGVVIPVGARFVVPRALASLEDPDSGIPVCLRSSLSLACEEIRELETRVRHVEQQLRALSKQMPEVQRLQTIPGIGLLTSTALVATVGDPRRFRSGRKLASFLGLTPREYSSGNTRRLGRIWKRGDPYLRTLLIHGARAVLNATKNHPTDDAMRLWALTVEQRQGHNKAAIALANKLARGAWAVWSRAGTTYRPRLATP